MKTNITRALCAAAVLGVVLPAAPVRAQGRSCDGGRGVEVADLGFERPRMVTRTDPTAGRGVGSFDREPVLRGVRGDGPAAGQVRDGDVLVAIDNQPITSAEAARRYSEVAPGAPVRLSVRREGRVHDVTIAAGVRCMTLAPAPPAPPAAPAAPLPPSPSGELMPKGRLGFAIDCDDCGKERVDGVETFRFRKPPTVTSVEPGSEAANAGVRAGDRLTHVDGVSLTSASAWPRWSGIVAGQSIALTFQRDGQSQRVVIRAR
jgi:S1-C subfamily serine protease